MPGIDGLRALAVAAVFVYHAKGGWLPGGFLGVDVFFVISGYLITSLLLAEFSEHGGIDLGGFWRRRARRLLPADYALIGACLIVGATFERGTFALRGDALAAIFYVANWRFIFEHQSYFAQFGKPSLFRHLWSLAVEEQFYLLWPPLLLLGLRLRARRALPLVVAAGALASTALMATLYTPGTDTSRVFYGTDTRSAPLLVGVVLAFVWRPGSLPRIRRSRLDRGGVVALAAVIAAFAVLHDGSAVVYRGGFLALALCTAVLLASVVHPSGSLGGLFSRPFPRWLGERSYAVYLWHWPVIVLCPAGRLWTPFVQVGATAVLAESSYRWIERPIRRGALSRVQLRMPRLVAQPRTPFAVAGLALAALVALAVVEPPRVNALPPGFTKSTLAASKHTETHLVSLPRQRRAPVRRHAAATPKIPRSGPILALGDSVMLGASSALTAALGPELRVDAVVARQIDDTIARIQAYKAAGTLPRRVIVQAGENGPLYYADWSRLRAALLGIPLVVLVNVRVDRPWQDQVNKALLEAIAGWRHATIADWYDASGGKDVLVDGTHTTPGGAKLYAALIARALRAPKLGGITR
jgi:peptidoglycan/LPS O-acetylase OafA/YrhL